MNHYDNERNAPRNRYGDNNPTEYIPRNDRQDGQYSQHGGNDESPETQVFPAYADEDFAQREQRPEQQYPQQRSQYNQQYNQERLQQYVTKQELLENENQRLHEELETSQESLNAANEENETLEEEFAKKSRSLWIAIAVLAILMLLAVFFAFNQSSKRGEIEDAMINGDTSESQLFRDMEQQRDDATRRADDAEAVRSDLQSQLDKQTSRADDAERTIKNQERDLSDRDREISSLKDRLDSAERASSETVTQTVTTTVSPAPEENNNNNSEPSGGFSDLFSRDGQ